LGCKQIVRGGLAICPDILLLQVRYLDPRVEVAGPERSAGPSGRGLTTAAQDAMLPQEREIADEHGDGS
jgi:hypothetical protein